MGYAKIQNLYKNQDILLFKQCIALEKIHGTSSHISHKNNTLKFFSGGSNHERFVSLFDQESLLNSLRNIEAIIYGEAYGGKIMGMSETYGKDLKFIAFDVLVNDLWLSVSQAESFCKDIGIEFVHYERVSTELKFLDEQRDADSVQAIRNGMGAGKKREGVVLRPILELTKNDGSRIVSKHKRDDFKETRTPRVVSPEKLQVLEDAEEIATEWVTPMRLVHILDKMGNPSMENMVDIIQAMSEDIRQEAEGEIVWDIPVKKAIGRNTAALVKEYFKKQMRENELQSKTSSACERIL